MWVLSFLSVETWVLLLTLLLLFVVNGYSTYGLFKKLGVPGPSPRMYLGSVGRHNKVYYLDDLACSKEYGKVWGTYELRLPVLMVTEPQMIRTVMVKECFSYFTNRRNMRLNGDLADALSLMEDDRWRKTRNILSPFFSSGRIKDMFKLMKHHSGKLTQVLRTKAENKEVIEVKRFFGAYTLDVMVSSTCNVDLDTVNNRDSPFVTHASTFLNISLPIFMFQSMFPVFLPLMEKLNLSIFPRSSTQFFLRFLQKVQENRSQDSQQDPTDLLRFMTDTQTESKTGGQVKGLTDREIFAQAAMFVFAGYDTSGTTLSFIAYNLAQNPAVMSRLQKEIDATFPDKGPKDYETLMQMEYLDCVVSETLRLYPSAARLERQAKETIEVNNIKIPKGTLVAVPVFALHRDPDLWPEPEAFQPERFSRNNKGNIVPYSYLPFGAGPRNCLGMRFALMMVKLALVEVLQNYSFSVCEETEIPLQLDPVGLLGPLKPIKLRVETRV